MDHDVDLPGKESLRGPDKVLLTAPQSREGTPRIRPMRSVPLHYAI